MNNNYNIPDWMQGWAEIFKYPFCFPAPSETISTSASRLFSSYLDSRGLVAREGFLAGFKIRPSGFIGRESTDFLGLNKAPRWNPFILDCTRPMPRSEEGWDVSMLSVIAQGWVTLDVDDFLTTLERLGMSYSLKK